MELRRQKRLHQVCLQHSRASRLALANRLRQDVDDGTGISRASSVSMRDRANGGKKSRRRRDSDTFETRSNYVAYAPAYGHSHQPTWVQPQYVSATAQYASPAQQPYPAPMPSMYGGPNQPYAPMMPAGGYVPQYNNNMVNVSESAIRLYSSLDTNRQFL